MLLSTPKSSEISSNLLNLWHVEDYEVIRGLQLWGMGAQIDEATLAVSIFRSPINIGFSALK
jgi:hypothetical protein